jgi:type VI secretion system FHA domain protein
MARMHEPGGPLGALPVRGYQRVRSWLPMSLTLSVLTYRNQPPPRAISATFRGSGGTIGRLDQNALVLPDPERVISRTHARVEFRAGSYFITALGQNPIDLNGRPLGAGETAQLSSGDKLTIGDYSVAADVQLDEAESALAGVLTRPSTLAEPFGPGLVPEPESNVAFGIPLTGGSPPPTEGKRQPAGPPPMSMWGTQQRDEVPGFLEPLPPARLVSPIPDDYDLLRGLEGDGEPPRPTGAAAPTVQPQAPMLPEDPFAETVPLERARPVSPESVQAPSASTQPAAPPFAAPTRPAEEGDYARAVRAFLEAAGVPELESRALSDPNFVHNAGELLREAIAGLLKALAARALTKGELRLDMTMLAAVENNPLKFSPNAYEALIHLLAPRPAAGYLPPLRAVREAYQDLEAHNLAVMAGMRAALLGVLQRFDPSTLEKRLASHALLDKLLPVNRKARMWDLVAEQHADLVREAQDEFDRIFGRAFREAYQEQVEKLRAATKRPSSLL